MSARVAASCDTCGFAGTYRSTAQAEYALRQHNCAKRQARAARGRAYAQARAAIDRTPKPCHHKRTTHQHGTYAAYHLDGCRCTPCSTAATDYGRTRDRRTAYGTWQPFIDAQPVRDHIATLMAAGVGLKRITELTGINGGVMCKLVYGQGGRPPSRRVRHATATKILAVRLTDIAPGQRVDATGTRRRLQALTTLGWTAQQLADQAGLDRQVIDAAITGRRHLVIHGNAATITALYDRLWNTPAPPSIGASRAIARAAKNGWLAPLAWDDDAIDDPSHTPVTDSLEHADVDEVAVQRAISGDRTTLTPRETDLAVTALARQGLSDSQIATRIGVAVRTVLRSRQRTSTPAAIQSGRSTHREERTA